MIHWTELNVTGLDGNSEGLAKVVRLWPELLDTAVIENGGIAEWPCCSLSAPGENPDWNTPRDAVDWTGFELALIAGRIAQITTMERFTLIDPTDIELIQLDVAGSGVVLRGGLPIVLIAQDDQNCYWAVPDPDGDVFVGDPYTDADAQAKVLALGGRELPDLYNQGFSVQF